MIKRIRIKSNPNHRKEKVEEEIQEKNVIETPGDRFEDDTLLSQCLEKIKQEKGKQDLRIKKASPNKKLLDKNKETKDNKTKMQDFKSSL